MGYGQGAWERAMKVQEVILRAIGGELSWIAASEILRMSPRTLRRWKHRYERQGYEGLFDRRRQVPSPRRVPVAELGRVLRLYRETYRGFNVAHFHETCVREHGVKLSYSLVKKALQEAGLVRRRRARGRHRLRREPRARFGEMLHLDGSKHVWLDLRPKEHQVLISVIDDATKDLLYAQLWPGESTEAVLSALHAVLSGFGLPAALYTDRAGWAAYTPIAGGKVDRSRPTLVGLVLRRLSIQHILSYSPQARGRVERLNRTLQDRLVNELRVARIDSVEAANAYIRRKFIPQYRKRFRRDPREPQPAFVPLGNLDLDLAFCEQVDRHVAPDNTVTFHGLTLQIPRQSDRVSCQGLIVTVCRHLDGRFSIWRAHTLFAAYDRQGRPRPRSSRLSRRAA